MLGDTLQRSPAAIGGLITIAGSLLCLDVAGAQQASSDEPRQETLLEILVTGSRIKRTEAEGPAPVTTITHEQLEREGFTTAYEAVYSLTQSTGGDLEGQFFPGTATSNATTVDLRGLGPGRTLILFNGRRAADYPLPFDGVSNIVNLSAIPVAALERIEVLSSGASAVYGSDAVAGVINFVMRDHFDGIEVNVRGGQLYAGGGDSERVQLTGGLNGERFSAVYALEYLNRDPIFAVDNRRFDSLADDRSGNGATANLITTLVSLNPATFSLNNVGATAAGCEQFGGGAHVVNGPAPPVTPFPGPACAGPTGQAQRTIRNETEAVSGFLNSSYEFSDSLQAFGTLSVWHSDSGNTPQLPVWQGPKGAGAVLDVGPNSGGGTLLLPGRFFQLSEATREPVQKFDELAWDTVLGLRGAAGKLDWEFSYHRSDYEVERDNRQLLNQATNDFFFGPQLGSVPFLPGLLLPIHSVPDYSRFVTPLTPAQFRSITDFNHTEADSSNDQVSAVLSGELFKLPAGAVQFASVLEWGTQEYDIHLDPREPAGEFAGIVASFPGGGSRDRYAAGLELAVPVLEPVRLTLAGRYDKYDDVTDVDDAFTYNLGLEYRPFKQLLLRGSYATSFRAPDMHFVFAGASSTLSNPRDALRCRRDFGVTDLNQCVGIPGITGNLVTTERQGNRALKEEEGKSWTAGFAWNVTPTLDVTLDYFDIQLENMVNDLTADFITQTEADCVLGQTLQGAPVDPNSAQCQFITGLVTRAVPIPGLTTDSIVQLNTLPINRAFEGVTGLDASLNYTLDANRWGRFFFNLGWSHILKEERQEFAGDPVDSYRDDSRNRDLRSKIRSSLTWEKSGFSQTLYVDRQGSRPTYAANFTVAPTDFRTKSYSVYNYTASYTSPADTWSLALIVDNLFDADPKIDRTFAGWPFFFGQNVNPYGREVFIQAGYRFK